MAQQVKESIGQDQANVKNNQERKMIPQEMSRKKFLHSAGLGIAGAALSPAILFPGFPGAASPKAKIALQLYTVRDAIGQDIAGTFHKIAEAGYKAVETAFWPEGVSLKQAAKLLREAGLTVSSSHVEIPQGDKKRAMLETAEAFGSTRMIWHGWPEDKRYSSLEGTKELAGIYNEAGHFARSNGLQFGLHNHWWEYRNRVGGRYVYQVLLELVDPDIFFEIDTYWVKVAGHDPAKIVGEFGKRAPLLHIKDGPAKWHDSLAADNPDPMVPVGRGTQDFPAIARAAKGNTEWMIVEMDKVATDVFAAIRDSHDYLIRKGLAVDAA
jgi:sugar phosphate isomerase/epimerase